MSYKRIGTPKIYVDWVNWMNVQHQESIADAVSLSAGTMASGTIEDAFDVNPTNTCVLNTDAVSQFVIKVDSNMGTDSYMDYDYIAILGHDIHSANTKFRIATSDDWSTFAYPTMTGKVNATASGGWATPTLNGWSIAEWTQTTNNRYIGIEFKHDDESSNMSADITIGAIMLGKKMSFPHRPNLSHKIDKVFKTKLKESLGGARYSVALNSGHNDWGDRTNRWYNTYTTNSEWNTRVGRHIFNLSWSYIQDTDMWRVQDDVTDEFTGNDTSIENLLIDKVHGSHLPFIFQIDDSNYSDGFYLVRMTKHSMQQTAPNLWTFSCTLEEEL